MAAIVFLSLFALAAGMNLPLGPGEDCTEEGKSWSWDCNTCTCMNGKAACTQMACPPKSGAVLGPGEECKNEGESWPWECNTCTCSSGVATCTQKACQRKKREADTAVLGPGDACTNEGESWAWECNTCMCQSGFASCTRKGCVIRTPVDAVAVLGPGEECKNEGESWPWECNTCTCSSGVATCTQKACQRKKREADKVVLGPGEPCANEGETWKWECNQCACTSGMSACTQKACHRRKRSTGAACTPETVWTKDCQKCKCDSTGVAHCEAVPDCIPSGAPPKTSCQPGEEWMQDCNKCKCNDDGKGSCTRKLCESDPHYEVALPGERRKRETPVKSCTPQTVWTKNCQSCKCDSTGVAHCEAVPDCVPSDAPEKTTCSPGEEWMRDCNRCKCNDDGVAACTRKLCMSDPHYEVVLPEENKRRKRDTSGKSCTPLTVWTKNCESCKCNSEGVAECKPVPDCVPSNTTPKTTCEPGEKWKNECNNCHCTESGVPACTKKLCESSPHYEVVLPPSEERKKRDIVEEKIEKTEVDCLVGQNFWGQGCEWCTCYEGGNATCVIDKDCLKKEEEKENIKQEVQQEETVKREKRSPAGPPPDCAPGQTYKDDCNTCTCVENGPPYCTLKLCVTHGNVGTYTYKPTSA